MQKKEDRFWLMALAGLFALGVVVFGITYMVRSWQLDRYMENMADAVSDSEEESDIDIAAIKVGYDGQTYTLDEFVELDEIPVVVDILIMNEDGGLSNKQAYVSCSTEDTDAIQYIDGAYGRLILPSRYSGKVAEGNVG